MKVKFYPALLGISLISILLHYFIFEQLSFSWNEWIWGLYLYFPLTTLIIHRLLIKRIAGRPQSFVTVFMGTMAAKLFISLMLLLLVLFLNPEIKIPFALSFLYLYLLYTSLTTYYIFSNLRGK